MEKVEAIKKSALFKNFDENSIKLLVNYFEELEFDSGGVVFEEKEIADGLYIILDGAVDIFIKGQDGNQVLLGRLIQQEFFGQLALVGNFEHLTRAVAQENTTLLRLSRSRFADLNKVSPQISLKLLINIFTDFAKILQESSEVFRFIVEDYYSKKRGGM